MFGFSFGEFVLICVVALVAVGPQKLPGLLRTLGEWIRKARNVLTDMRAQSGIDDILRAEGLHGGLNELRHLVRSHTAFPTDLMSSVAAAPAATASAPPPPVEDLYGGVDIDPSKEYPPEGCDSYGALPDDLVSHLSPYALPSRPEPSLEATPSAESPSASPIAEGAEPEPGASNEPRTAPTV